MLRDYQIQDVAYHITNRRSLNTSDPGTGKTPTAAVYTNWCWLEKGERVIWIQPISLVTKNRDELLDPRFSKFGERDMAIIEGRTDNQVLAEVLSSAKVGALLQEFKEKPPANDQDAAKVVRQFTRPKAKNKRGPISSEAVLRASRQGLLEIPEPANECSVLLTERGRQMLDLGELDPFHGIDPKVLLMGPETFAAQWPALLARFPDINAVVADEIHKYWSTGESKRTQEWFRAMRKIDRFLGLTGTLINGRYSSAYPAIHVIEPRYYGSYVNFMAWHAELDFFGNITGWKNPERLGQILLKHSVRHSFTEVYGPEAKVIIPEYAEMSPGQQHLYGELHAKAMIELEDRFIAADAPGVFALRARQVLAHPEMFDCDEPTGKDALNDIHFSNPGPLVVFSAFLPEQARINALALAGGRRSAVLNGDLTLTQRGKLSKAFQSGEYDTLVCSPGVADVGYNWPHVDRMVFSSCDYQDSTFFQAYRRAIRGKRDRPLLIYVQKYRKTVEDRIWEIIERKSREANAVDPSREVYSL